MDTESKNYLVTETIVNDSFLKGFETLLVASTSTSSKY